MPASEPATDPIAELVAGRYRDPETGEALQAASRAIAIERSLAGGEVELVAALGIGPKLAVVSDANTYEALGARVEAALSSRFTIERVMLPAGVAADVATIERIDAGLPPVDGVVAVGSGTINDLCKMVALRRGVPQVVFATAPSMNGYTSVSASITDGGLKRSVRAATPIGAFFDLEVLAAAPVRLIRAGLGDSVARGTAQADWLLAHLLLDRPYRELPFTLLAGDEAMLLGDVRGLVSGDVTAIHYLTRTLVLSGFGMTLVGGSFPASQGEHLLSHYVELVRPDLHAYHGEQIAVATVAMAHLQDRVLAGDPPVLRTPTLTRDELVGRFGAQGDACWQELAKKLLDDAATEAVNARLEANWDAIRDRILGVALGAARTIDILYAAGAPVLPTEIGWPLELLDDALEHAREIRDRYTFLDLAADSM